MIKCIVWDLDGTLWRGTLAEGDTPTLFDEAVRTVREADKRGVVQSVASRNNAEAAAAQLAAFGLDTYFLYPRIEPFLSKPDALGDIAARFNIGMDAIAFVDDDPFERYEVNRFLPEAYVYAESEIGLLREEITRLPMPTADRRAWMEAREARLRAESAFTGSRADFLRECHMTLTVRGATALDLPRVRELAGRARRINSAYGQTNALDAAAYLGVPDKKLYVCELVDRFGQHGLVGAVFFRKEPDEQGETSNVLHIDTFFVSCRVEGRGIAAAFLNETLRMVMRSEDNPAVCRCRCADCKDGMAATLLKSLGFRVTDRDGVATLLSLRLPHETTDTPWLTMKTVGED